MVSKLGVLLETHSMKYIHIVCRLISHNQGWEKYVILSKFYELFVIVNTPNRLKISILYVLYNTNNLLNNSIFYIQ